MIVTSDQFATAHGMTIQVARRHFAKGTYRGEHLPVVQVPGQRGGKGGTVWALRLDACSDALRAKLAVHLPTVDNPLETPVKAPFKGSFQPWQFDEQAARLEIIRPILAVEKHSAERAEAFRMETAKPHIVDGAIAYRSETTLREWVSLYEARGQAALMPMHRADRGQARVLVTRAWDDGIDLSGAQKTLLSERLALSARSMIANDGTSGREVIRLSEKKLVRLCLEAGSQLSRAQLVKLCKLNRKWVARFDQFRLVHMKAKDHKTWQDRAVPRIRRDLHSMPMGLLIGDVHYVDMSVEVAISNGDLATNIRGHVARSFGKQTIRVRLIAWMDAASHFLWVTPVFLSKGMGIRQEDVAESLAQVTLCPHGGIPQEFYLDRGSEYSALADAMARLSVLAVFQFGVTLAKPYSPTSKGAIEGVFNILEGIIKGLPGWIGGDRTNKKTVNKGHVVAPYAKGLDALEDDIRAAVAIYNDRPQSGRLNGLSPLQMLENKINSTGFEARQPSAEAFDMIFSRQDIRTIRNGGHVTLDGNLFYGECLETLLPGERVEVLIPLRANRERVFIKHRGRDLGWAELMPTFAHADRAGAKYQSKLEGSRGRAVARLAAQVDPAESTFENQKAAVERIAPNTPAPAIWTHAIDKTAINSTAERDAKSEAAQAALLEFMFPSKDMKRRGASGGNR